MKVSILEKLCYIKQQGIWYKKVFTTFIFFIASINIIQAQNKGIYSEINKYLSKQDTITAIQMHRKFSSLNEIKHSNSPTIKAINTLAEIFIHIKNKEYNACDSIFRIKNLKQLHTHACYLAYYHDYLALNYSVNLDKQKTLENTLLAKTYFEQIHDTSNVIKMINNACIYYMNYYNFSKSKELGEQAYKLAKKTNDEYAQRSALLNLGTIYLYLQDSIKALETYKKLERNFNLRLIDKEIIYGNMGSVYFDNKDYENAKIYYDSLVYYSTKLKDTLNIAKGLSNLGYLAFKLHKYKKADSLFRESLLPYQNNRFWEIKTLTYNRLIELYGQLDKMDSVLKYIDLYQNYMSKQYDAKNQKALLEVSAKYENKEKDKELALSQKKEELSQIKLHQQEVMIIITILIALLSILALLIINKHRKRLKTAKKELQYQRDKIAIINEDLKISIKAKDRILSVIGHDLRGPVGGLKSLLELYLDMQEWDEKEIKDLLYHALQSSTNTYLLLENLLTWANSQRGNISFIPKTTTVYPIVNQTVQILNQSIDKNHILIKIDIDLNLKAFMDIDMIKIVLRNILSNCIKFSPDKGTISISAKEKNNAVLFCIQDEGIGMEEHEVKTLFTKKETYFLEDKNNAKGTGLGLILCKEFVERHGGSIWVESKKGQGSIFYFSLPKKIHIQINTN